VDHRKTIDQLTYREAERKEAIEGLTVREPLDEEIAGLKYRPGDLLTDKVTGKEVEILGGKRAAVTLSSPGGGGSEGVSGEGQGGETSRKD